MRDVARYLLTCLLTCLLAYLLTCLLAYLLTACLGSLALVHIDADAYESVLDALDTLYPRLSMWKTADHRLRPVRPPALTRPASARSSSGQPPASASLGQLADTFWLAVPTSLVFYMH